jgi:hypothetical protein
MEIEAVYLATPSAEVYNECIRAHIILYGTCVRSVTETVFFYQSTSVFSYLYHPPVLYTHSLVCHQCHRVLTIDIVVTSSTKNNAWNLHLLSQVASVMYCLVELMGKFIVASLFTICKFY